MECNCGGKGFIFYRDNGRMRRKLCECGILKDFKTKIEPADFDDKELESKIPNPRYRVDFDREKLEESMDIPERLMDIQVGMHIDFMDEFIRTVRLGVKPRKSYFLVAPSGMGKKYFVYNAIRSAYEGGLKPSGLIDTYEVYEKMDKRELGELREMFDVDIAFMTMGGSPGRLDIVALKTVLDICDRKGIPLVVISRHTAGFLVRQGKDPLLTKDIGVFMTAEYDYGCLERVGFSDEFMAQYTNHVSRELRGGVESVADYKDRVRRGEE